MEYHIAVVDEDNYIRFATLAITDLWFGRLHEAMVNGDVTLIIGEPNPLQMTPEQRKNQKTYTIGVPEEGGLACIYL